MTDGEVGFRLGVNDAEGILSGLALVQSDPLNTTKIYDFSNLRYNNKAFMSIRCIFAISH